MALCVVRREAAGRPGFVIPARVKRVWLCNLCDWWGLDGTKIHRSFGDATLGAKHRAEETYEADLRLVTRVFARAQDVPPNRKFSVSHRRAKD